MIDKIKKFFKNFRDRDLGGIKNIQYPEMDLETLEQMHVWLLAYILKRISQRKSIKQARDLLRLVTARILEEKIDGRKN